jgi:hypothetical protein
MEVGQGPNWAVEPKKKKSNWLLCGGRPEFDSWKKTDYLLRHHIQVGSGALPVPCPVGTPALRGNPTTHLHLEADDS